jgi:hypothetical protein
MEKRVVNDRFSGIAVIAGFPEHTAPPQQRLYLADMGH